MADDQYTVAIDVATIRSANISRYADGYNYASVTCKTADKEFMTVHYEWQGKVIPEFAMQVMDMLKIIGQDKASIKLDSNSVEYLERASKVISNIALKSKK